MSKRREFQITEEDVQLWAAAGRPAPGLEMKLEHQVVANPEEASKMFAISLGERMRFKWWTIERVPNKTAHFFTAVPFTKAEWDARVANPPEYLKTINPTLTKGIIQ